MDDIPIWSTN